MFLVQLTARLMPPDDSEDLWVVSLWLLARSPATPWQSSCCTVAVSGLSCQTKPRRKLFSRTVPRSHSHPQVSPAHFLPHSESLQPRLQSYVTVNTAGESGFVSPCQRVLIIGECQGCLPGPPHFLCEPSPVPCVV